MGSTELDHLVVVAPTLAAGADFVFRAIAATMVPGGEHPAMGTHNLLLRLGAATYLEVIAVNPAAPGPQRPRWFGLDRLAGDDEPRLATWVARTSNIERACSSAPANIGPAELMTRGTLRWKITIPSDGDLVHGGLVPALIQWQSASHPAAGLPNTGYSLNSLKLLTPDAELLREQLKSLGLSDAAKISRAGGVPRLAACIGTPAGKRLLG
ncbi:MAG: VOC family protein [Proteobacteria bacterium]|nr:VOC family protein [Pseudomonadota bacterium]